MQLFQLDPTLSNHPPIPSSQDFDTPGTQDFVNKVMGVASGASGFMEAPPLMAGAGLLGALVDQFTKPRGTENTLGSPVGQSGTEAGMNSLPLSTIMKLAVKDSETALAGPTIHDIINARNDVYHATTEERSGSIQDSGQIKPGLNYSGVSTSRVPVINTIGGKIRYVIDPDKVPQMAPLAESEFYKTIPAKSIGDILNSASDNELADMKQEALDKGYSYDQLSNPMINKAILMGTDTYNKVKDRTTPAMNRDFEFENRTQNKTPINISKAVKELLVEVPDFGKSNTHAISNALDSNNPLPARLIKSSDLPLYKILKTLDMSQQVTGKRLSQ